MPRILPIFVTCWLLFSSLSHKRSSHVQGKIYGLIDSTDTLAALFSFGIVLWLNEVNCTNVLLISSGVFLISGLLFYYLLKIKPNIYEY